MKDHTQDGKDLRVLNIFDEYTREYLSISVGRHLTGDDVIDCLTTLFCTRAIPVHLRSDNGSEFTNHKVRTWLNELGAKTLFIDPGSPWENGYIESFNGKMRDELLNREIFYTLQEARVIIEQWRCEYNMIRPHSSLGDRPPAPEAVLMPELASPLVAAVVPTTT